MIQRLDLVNQLGARGARQYRLDHIAGQSWAAAARRALYTTIWTDAAEHAGAHYRELGGNFIHLKRANSQTIAWFHNVQLDDPVTLRLALDKSIVHMLLEQVGVAIPTHRQFSPKHPAAGLALLSDAGASYVIKPSSGTSGGSGVACAVDSIGDFHRATLHASRHSEHLLIERAVPGDEYRFLFLDGELLDVIRKRPPSIVGDGYSSVAELISSENARRAAAEGKQGITFLPVDLDCILTLDQAGLTLRSKLTAGAVVQVRSATNGNALGDNFTVERSSVADALVEEARRAAAVSRLRLAGVDLITPRLDRSLLQAGGAVIEVNGTPGLHYHYLVADPARATRVAIPVLETLLGSNRY